jgi:hypothetical protein
VGVHDTVQEELEVAVMVLVGVIVASEVSVLVDVSDAEGVKVGDDEIVGDCVGE